MTEIDFKKGVAEGRFYLGKLCPYNHEYENTAKSIRYKSNRECWQCSRDRYLKNPQVVKERAKKNSKSVQRIEKQKLWVKNNLSKVKQYKLKWKENNQDKIVTYRKTSFLLDRIRKHRYRAHKRKNLSSRYTSEQIKFRMQDFNDCCAYCGKPETESEKLHLDHIRPVSKGGSDTITNIAPACASCNCSKKNEPVLAWWRKQPFWSRESELFLDSIMGGYLLMGDFD